MIIMGLFVAIWLVLAIVMTIRNHYERKALRRGASNSFKAYFPTQPPVVHEKPSVRRLRAELSAMKSTAYRLQRERDFAHDRVRALEAELVQYRLTDSPSPAGWPSISFCKHEDTQVVEYMGRPVRKFCLTCGVTVP